MRCMSEAPRHGCHTTCCVAIDTRSPSGVEVRVHSSPACQFIPGPGASATCSGSRLAARDQHARNPSERHSPTSRPHRADGSHDERLGRPSSLCVGRAPHSAKASSTRTSLRSSRHTIGRGSSPTSRSPLPEFAAAHESSHALQSRTAPRRIAACMEATRRSRWRRCDRNPGSPVAPSFDG